MRVNAPSLWRVSGFALYLQWPGCAGLDVSLSLSLSVESCICLLALMWLSRCLPLKQIKRWTFPHSAPRKPRISQSHSACQVQSALINRLCGQPQATEPLLSIIFGIAWWVINNEEGALCSCSSQMEHPGAPATPPTPTLQFLTP